MHNPSRLSNDLTGSPILGVILALKAATDGLPVERLYQYEPPFRFSEEEPGLPEEVVHGIRQSPMWPQLEQLAQWLSTTPRSPPSCNARRRRCRL
jgi:hypothetical protein